MSETPVRPDYQAPPPQQPNTLALVSMILGIVSILIICVGCGLLPMAGYASPVLGIGAVIVGFMARKEITAGRQSGMGMAMAGIICGFVAIFLFLVLIVLMAMGASALRWTEGQIEELERQQRQQPQPDAEPAPGPAAMLRFYAQGLLAMLRIG